MSINFTLPPFEDIDDNGEYVGNDPRFMYDKTKFNLISEKLIEAGFTKYIHKSNLDRYKSPNDKIIQYLGAALEDDDNESLDKFSEMVFNKYVPEISFSRKDFELQFFLKKDLIKITTLVGSFIKERISFKNINTDDFFKLLVEKDYSIELILSSGSN